MHWLIWPKAQSCFNSDFDLHLFEPSLWPGDTNLKLDVSSAVSTLDGTDSSSNNDALLRAISIASYINLYQQEKVTKVAVNEINKTNRQNGKLVFKFLRNKV